jgi:hypothetical protein
MNSNTSSGSQARSRREVFEQQILELQRDIGTLSNKLSVPSLVTTARMNALRNPSTPSSADGAGNYSNSSNNTFNNGSRLPVDFDRSFHSALSTASHGGTSSVLSSPATATPAQFSLQDYQYQQSRMDLLTTELREAVRQRDEALRQAEQVMCLSYSLRFIRLSYCYS